MDVLISMWRVARNATIGFPAMELLILLAALSFCLVFRFNKIGLLTAYLFSYKWGWAMFANVHDQRQLLAYLVFGMLVGVLSVIGLLKSPNR